MPTSQRNRENDPATGCKPMQGEIVNFFDKIPAEVRERMQSTTLATGSTDYDSPENVARRKARRNEERREEIWQASGLAELADSCSLEGFRSLHDTQDRAIFLINYFANYYPNVSKGLMLWGQSGVGKSRLLKVCARLLIDLPEPVKIVYCSCADLQKKSYAEGMAYLNDVLLKARVIVLDDIEKAWGKPSSEKVVKLLIEEVDNYGKIKLLASSNFPLNKVADYVIDGESGLCHKDMVPDFIYGRMARLFKWHEVAGPNYRVDVQAAEDWEI